MILPDLWRRIASFLSIRDAFALCHAGKEQYAALGEQHWKERFREEISSFLVLPSDWTRHEITRDNGRAPRSYRGQPYKGACLYAANTTVTLFLALEGFDLLVKRVVDDIHRKRLAWYAALGGHVQLVRRWWTGSFLELVEKDQRRISETERERRERALLAILADTRTLANDRTLTEGTFARFFDLGYWAVCERLLAHYQRSISDVAAHLCANDRSSFEFLVRNGLEEARLIRNIRESIEQRWGYDPDFLLFLAERATDASSKLWLLGTALQQASRSAELSDSGVPTPESGRDQISEKICQKIAETMQSR